MIDVIKLTQELIHCPSVTPEDGGSQNVLINVLKEMGFKIYDLPFEGRGSYPVKNFFARLGTSTPHICYAGHTDVVPVGDEAAWTHPPFGAVIKDGIMYGRGTSDMKGGNAAFVSATSKFIETHKDFNGSISLLITCYEEGDAKNGTDPVLQWMKENNHIPDMCLVGESSNIKTLGEEIKIGRRGSFRCDAIIKGKQGHVAYPEAADNPMPKLAAVASALSAFKFDEGTEHFPPTNLEITNIEVGNKARNVIPANGVIEFNVRFNTTWTDKTLAEKLKEILSTVTPDYELQYRCGAHPFLTEPGPWTKIVENVVAKHTKRIPKLSTSGGTSDARFIANYCRVVEFGLTNETIHQVDECLKVTDLERLVDIYADIIEEALK
jgi:succinyl-diaminopimelate desuccinylase